MSTHYITCAPIAVLGGFVVVVSLALSAPIVAWIAFGIAVGVIAIAVLAQLDRARGGVQRTLDGGIVAVSVLLLVFSLVASGSTVRWLSFAFALGIVALAEAGLTLHAVSHWRAEHRVGELHWLRVDEHPAETMQSHVA